MAAKEAAKFNPEDQAKVVGWIHEVTGDSMSGEFLEWLKDGRVLVSLVNKLSGSTIKANESAMPFKQMENISNFLKQCREKPMAMRENDLFTVPDLFDGKSKFNVINGLISVSRAATKGGYKGASIAPKESSGGEGKKWDVSKASSEVSKLSMGSSATMQETAGSRSNDINFGAKMAGTGVNGSVSKLNMGSAGTMEENTVSKSNDINFGAKMSGTGVNGAVSKMNMGSAGTMEANTVSRSNNIDFGAKAGKQ